MKLKFRILTIVLSLALLLGSMSVFTVSAATALDITGFYNATGEALYVSNSSYQKFDTASASWRMFFHTNSVLEDANAQFGDYVVTWDNGGATGQSAVQLFPQILDQGIIWAVIWGVPDAATLVDGATMKIAAGTGTASNGNTITMNSDVNLKWDADTQTWEYIATPAYKSNALTAGAANGVIGMYATSSDSIPYIDDWSYRYHDVASQGSIVLVRDGVETELEGAYIQKFTAGDYYINFDGSLQAGDRIIVDGVFTCWHWNDTIPVANKFTGTHVEFVRSGFDFDGTNWTTAQLPPESEEDTSVKVTHLDVITDPSRADRIYTQLPTTNGITVDASWATRFYPETEADGGFFNGTRFELDGGGGMPIQAAAGASGLYITGFGTAVAGDKVVIKGRFYSMNRDTQVKNGEVISFVAPVEFTFDGTNWIRTSAIPEIEITYDNEYTGTFTNAGSQLANGTNPNQLYLKGSEGLAGAFEGDYTDYEWNNAPLIASGDDSGFFLNGTKVNCNMQQYSYSQQWYFADGMGASAAGDILTIKGAFTNQDYSVKLNIEECQFIWDGSKWADYVPGTVVNYNDMTVDSVYNFSTNAGDWRFNLNVNGTWPTAADFEAYAAPTVVINGTELGASVIETYKNGNYLMLCLWGSLTAAAPVKGDVVTIKAGQSVASSDETVGINITEDFVLYYNGTEWSTTPPGPDYTYHDFKATGLQQVIYSYEADGTTIKYRHFYLTIDGSVPGNWDKFEGLQISVNGGEKQSLRVGNNGSTGVICFDVHSSQMPVDIAVGTTMTLHAGEAPAAADAANVNATDAIRLTEDYTLEWNGTNWVVPGAEEEVTDYLAMELTGIHENTNLNGGANWHIYLNTSAAMPGEAWGMVGGTAIAWEQKVVIDGTAYTVSAKKWDANGLFIEFPASYLSDAAEHTLTVLAGQYKSNVGNLGYELTADFEIVGDGTSWSVPTVEDPTVYLPVAGSGILPDTAIQANGTMWHVYLNMSDVLPGANWEIIDNVSISFAQVVEIDGVTYTVTAKKANEQTLFIEFPVSYLSDAAEHTLTLKAGKVKSDLGGYGYELTEDFTVTGDGTSWAVPSLGVYDTIGFNGAEHGWKADNGYWDIHYTTTTTIAGTDWVTVFDGLTVEIGGVAVDAVVKKAGSKVLNVFYVGAEPEVGTSVVIRAGKADASDAGVNGIEVVEDYEMYWDGEKMVAVTVDNTVYNDVTVEGIVNFGTADNDWRFNLAIGGDWPAVEGELVGLSDLAVYINETKLDGAVIDLYKNGNNLMACLWGDLTNGVAPVEGDKVTIKAGQARFTGTDLGINLLYDVVLEYNGTAWVLEGYVDNHVYTDVELKLPILPSGFSAERNRWELYFPVEGTIPGAADDGNNSAFDYVKVSVRNSAGELVMNKGSFRAFKAAHGDGTFFFMIETSYLSIEEVDKGSVLTVHAGKLASPVNDNGINIVKDFQVKWTGNAWLALDYDSKQPDETNVKLTIDRGTAYGGNANGVYLLTDDNFPVDTTWVTRIAAATYDGVSGVYLNDQLIAGSNLCRFAEGKVYVTLLDAGITAKDKDKLTIKGMFLLNDYAVSYKEYTLYFNGKHWNEKYEVAPEETYTKIYVQGVAGMVTSHTNGHWNVYLELDTMIPGDVDTMTFNGLKVIGYDGKEHDAYVAHSWNHHLYLSLPEEVLPLNAKDGAYVILKAGKALSPQDQCSGIQLMEDVKIYYYKGGISELEPTDDTVFEEVTITRMNQTSKFDPATNEWRFHWVIPTPLQNVESGVTFAEIPMDINGTTHKVRVLRDGNYLYVRVPASALPGDTKTGYISIAAGAKGYANSGHNGIEFTNDWIAYIYDGIISEVEFTEDYRQSFDIIGVQAVTPTADRIHLYLRINREMPGSDWYEGYHGFTFLYNGVPVTTTAWKSASSNNKFLYIPAVYKDIGIDAPQEGDIITIPEGSVGDGGGYEIEVTNTFELMYSDGLWTQYIETDVEAPAASDGSIWEEFRFEEGYIPVLQENGKVLWSNEDTYHDIISTEKYMDYTFNIEVQKAYNDETTPPFYVILRGNPVSETDPMTAEMLYGYVLQFSAAEMQDPADPTNPDARIWSQYISLWKNGVNGALIDQYRINYVHEQTDHPFFQYEDTHNYEYSIYNIDAETACITVKIDGRLVLRYYDKCGGLDPLDPAINPGSVVVSASCPGLITGDAVDLGELMVAKSECETGDRVRVAVTYPSTLDGAVFTVDGEGATIKDGVFTATKAGTYTIRATYNGKDYGSKTIVVKDPPKRELLDVGGDESEFPWLIVGIAGGAVVVAAVVVLIILLAKRKKKAATPTAE